MIYYYLFVTGVLLRIYRIYRRRRTTVACVHLYITYANHTDGLVSSWSSGSSNGGSSRPSPSNADAGGRRCRGNTTEPWCQYARPES